MCDNNRAGLLEQLLHKIKANRRREMVALYTHDNEATEGSGAGVSACPDTAAESGKALEKGVSPQIVKMSFNLLRYLLTA